MGKIIEKIIIETKKTMLEDGEKIRTKNTGDLREKQIAEFGKKVKERIFRLKQELFNFTIGLIEQRIIAEFKDLLKEILPNNRSTTTKAKKILTLAGNKFQKYFRKLVWNYRCEKRIEIDKIKGIDLRRKKNKTAKEKTRKETIENKEKNRVIEDPRKRNNPARTEMDKGEESSKRIIDWIREEIKWLGL